MQFFLTFAIFLLLLLLLQKTMASNVDISPVEQQIDTADENGADSLGEILIEQKEQVYEKIKSKIEILDMLFHPTETNLISIGLINGKLRL